MYCYKMASKEDNLKNAVRKGDKDHVVKLLDLGVDPNCNRFGSSGQSPLMLACLSGNVELIKLLIKRGANVDLQNYSGQTALTKVINSKNVKQSVILEVTKTLVEHDSTKSHFSKGMKAACEKGNVEVAKLLLPYGSGWDDDSLEALYRAAVQNGHASILKLLTGGEHTKELASEKWAELLHVACEGKDEPEVVQILLDKYPSIMNYVPWRDYWRYNSGRYNEKGYTALMRASARGHTKVVKLLLDRGAKIDYQNQAEHGSFNLNSGRLSALMVAAMNGQLDTMKLLLDEGANVDLTDKGGKTALMISVSAEIQGQSPAIYRRSKNEMRWDKGANLDFAAQERATAKERATAEETATTLVIMNRLNGAVKEVKLLLSNKANPDIDDRNGNSPLLIATGYAEYFPQFAEIVKLLVEKGATIDGFSKESPLIAACRYGNAELSKLFIEKGATVNYLDRDGGYALLYAVKYAADQYSYEKTHFFSPAYKYDADQYSYEKTHFISPAYKIAADQYSYEVNPPIFEVIELLLEKGAKYDMFTENDESASSVMQTNATLLTVSSSTIAWNYFGPL